MPHKSELLLDINGFLSKVARMEGTFGAASALMRYGSSFQVRERMPDWFKRGKKKNCYNNATVYAATRDDVWYAEGYASEPELPFPVEHAWLIDGSGEVIDPTWESTRDHVYFGIAFERDFVMETLEENGRETGILVNMYHLRRRNRGEGRLEAAIARGARPQFESLQRADRQILPPRPTFLARSPI